MTIVGVVGTGRMGFAMTRALRAAGLDVLVYNRTRARADQCAFETGATVAPTAAEVAAHADVTLTMLADDHGIDAEVIDLRTLVPLDVATILVSVEKTSRLFTVEENPRLCGWGAEIASIVADEGFYSLDAPIVRITTPHVPLPSAAALEDAAIPNVERIVDTVRRRLEAAK